MLSKISEEFNVTCNCASCKVIEKNSTCNV